MQVYDKEERQKVLYPTQLKMVENWWMKGGG